MDATQLGKFVRNACQARGWNPLRLSKEAGISYDTARFAFAGQLNPRLETTTKLVVALGHTVEFLEIPNPDALEMQETAISQLFELVRARGITNHYGHKRFHGVILIDGLPREFTDDDTLEISEDRASELLPILAAL